MPFEFNKELWDIGRKIEDEALPKLNKFLECNFKRDDSDIWDILDFRDDDKKVIVEVKGRLVTSSHYDDTIITASKVMAGFQAIDDGYKVYFLFVFTDKSMIIQLKEDSSFKVKFTGTNCIKHYCIPITLLKDFEPDIEEEL
tara:strand:- start:90 stop:515 length:426 start_codon:yes stop_codon:yes gene_type:complete